MKTYWVNVGNLCSKKEKNKINKSRDLLMAFKINTTPCEELLIAPNKRRICVK